MAKVDPGLEHFRAILPKRGRSGADVHETATLHGVEWAARRMCYGLREPLMSVIRKSASRCADQDSPT